MCRQGCIVLVLVIVVGIVQMLVPVRMRRAVGVRVLMGMVVLC